MLSITRWVRKHDSIVVWSCDVVTYSPTFFDFMGQGMSLLHSGKLG